MSDDESSDDYASDSPYEYVSSAESSDEDELFELPAVTPWTRTFRGTDLSSRVAVLSSQNCCKKKCLADKQAAIECFLYSMGHMRKEARKTAFLTALAVSAYTDTGQRKRGEGVRARFAYLAPFIGQVCKSAFQILYDVSHVTLVNASARVREGHAYAKPHGNLDNAHAATLDRGSVCAWFLGVVDVLGESTPMRFRRQKTKEGQVVRYGTVETITFLPAYLTWEELYNQYKMHVADQNPPISPPSYSAFYKLLRSRYKNVRIRSPRSNVCDVCSVYQAYQARTPTTLETETQASHVLDARAMRQQYAKDAGLASPQHFVSTIDYAQNIALPHNASTPSAWYFMSLINVSLFGVYTENKKSQVNYLYSERRAGKGSNEVASMLHKYALDNKIYTNGPGTLSWTVYADNCGGQNKNNHLVRFFLFLVDSGRLRSANLYFLVKGHTKNNCDRGFANVKRAYAKRNLYTLDHVERVVDESATTNSGVCLEHDEEVFRDWKDVLQPVYRDLKNIQSYQMFNMTSSQPGVVMCRKRPTGEVVEQKLAKSGAVDYDKLWKAFKRAPQMEVNPEKVADLHKKILSFIPEEFRDDDLYRSPTPEESNAAQEKKRRRRKTTLTLVQRMQAARKTASEGEEKQVEDDGSGSEQ